MTDRATDPTDKRTCGCVGSLFKYVDILQIKRKKGKRQKYGTNNKIKDREKN